MAWHDGGPPAACDNARRAVGRLVRDPLTGAMVALGTFASPEGHGSIPVDTSVTVYFNLRRAWREARVRTVYGGSHLIGTTPRPEPAQGVGVVRRCVGGDASALDRAISCTAADLVADGDMATASTLVGINSPAPSNCCSERSRPTRCAPAAARNADHGPPHTPVRAPPCPDLPRAPASPSGIATPPRQGMSVELAPVRRPVPVAPRTPGIEVPSCRPGPGHRRRPAPPHRWRRQRSTRRRRRAGASRGQRHHRVGLLARAAWVSTSSSSEVGQRGAWSTTQALPPGCGPLTQGLAG